MVITSADRSPTKILDSLSRYSMTGDSLTTRRQYLKERESILYETNESILNYSFQKVGSSLTLQIYKLLNKISRYSILLNQNEIFAYLYLFPDSIDTLYEAVSVTRKKFQTSEISVSVYSDPEIEDRYIIIYVREHSYNENFSEQLENIQLEIMKKFSNKHGWIHLTTDYKEPSYKK